MSHTPGPWIECHDADGTDFLLGPKAEGMNWAVDTILEGGLCADRMDENHANARLIAAAPDLLEALKAYVEEILKQEITLGPLTGDAIAAIEKAEGKP